MRLTPWCLRLSPALGLLALLWLALGVSSTTALATPAAPGGHLALSYGGDNQQSYPALTALDVPPPGGGWGGELRIAAVPNPFHGSTTLQLTLPANQAASIEIFDVAGRLVRHLTTKADAQPSASVVWDGRNRFGSLVHSGVYWVRAITTGQKCTARIVLLR